MRCDNRGRSGVSRCSNQYNDEVLLPLGSNAKTVKAPPTAHEALQRLGR
jgi:hypothetical protein